LKHVPPSPAGDVAEEPVAVDAVVSLVLLSSDEPLLLVGEVLVMLVAVVSTVLLAEAVAVAVPVVAAVVAGPVVITSVELPAVPVVPPNGMELVKPVDVCPVELGFVMPGPPASPLVELVLEHALTEITGARQTAERARLRRSAFMGRRLSTARAYVPVPPEARGTLV
jgi:hypothetical protein